MSGGRCALHPPARHVDGDDLPAVPGDRDSFAVRRERGGVRTQVKGSFVEHLPGSGVDEPPGFLGAVARLFENDGSAAVRGARGTAMRSDGKIGTARSQGLCVEEPHVVFVVPDEQPFALVDVVHRVDQPVDQVPAR